ncbi:hypothetical protein PCANC_23948 [Puccinia coronata f. sp. avenae]|uniref:Uncharacterized protein n=1 Tax=Puccinia coronata f. sp. avenae TaxID=200324 RepID=A0A2N5S3Y0_9BASI|nr:hypothetical protein PCANC_23948 [Puccinia coronata f. sp. avenae]
MGDDHLITKARYLGGSGVSADADRAWGSRTISNEINVNLPLGDRSSGKRRYQEIESHRDFQVAPSTTLPFSGSGSSSAVHHAKTGKFEDGAKFVFKHESSTEVLERIRNFYAGVVQDLEHWKDEIRYQFDRAEMGTISGKPPPHQVLIRQIDSLISNVKDLFREKLFQLWSPIADDRSSKKTLEELFRKVLRSVSLIEIDGPSEDLHALWERSRGHRWCELMMTLLADLQTHRILPESSDILSEFLNRTTRGQLVWQYINSRSSPSARRMYLNFDIKLSMQEDPSTEKFRHVLMRQ